MTQDELDRKLEELPPAVQDYLYGDDIGDLNGRIIERNALKDEDLPVLFALIKEAIVETFPVEALVDEVKKRFGIDEAHAKPLAADIAGFRLLPFDKTLGDVVAVVRACGGDPSTYPDFRLQLEERTSDQAADDVVHAFGTKTAERLQQRLQNIIQSFLSGIRTESQVKEALTRAEKVGGLGFDEASANRLMEEMKREAQTVIIRNDVVGIAAPPSQEAKQEDFATIRSEDEKEIKFLRQDVLPARGVEDADETAKKIAASVEEVYLASGLATEDEAMAKRIKSVIGSRLRDVRDPMETLEAMVQPKELGGLGLGQDAARALLGRIESLLKGVHEQHVETVREEKRQWVAREETQRAETAVAEKQQDDNELGRLYESIVRASKPPVAAPPPAPSAAPILPVVPSIPKMSVEAVPPPIPKGAPPTNLPVGNLEPVPEPLRTPTASAPRPPEVVPAAVPIPPVAAPKPLPPPATVTLVRPAPPAPDAPAQKPPAPPMRPKLEDVKPVAQLTGPVQELRLTMLADFRRLAKTPEEACEKIKGKIMLLADESYTKRNQGIAAWTASETHQTYLEMMREALAGQPFVAATAARRQAGKPVLTEEEFKAIAALSRQLRY